MVDVLRRYANKNGVTSLDLVSANEPRDRFDTVLPNLRSALVQMDERHRNDDTYDAVSEVATNLRCDRQIIMEMAALRSVPLNFARAVSAIASNLSGVRESDLEPLTLDRRNKAHVAVTELVRPFVVKHNSLGSMR